MTPAEIIDGLKVIQEYSRVRPAEMREAIAHLQPHAQPITPEGLEARGFGLDEFGIWRRTVESTDGRFRLSCNTKDGGCHFYVLIGAAAFTLPGVRTLGDVDDLVRMLEGGDGA